LIRVAQSADPDYDMTHGRVEFSDMAIDLVPEKLKSNHSYDAKENLQDVYSLAHVTVFEKEPHDRIQRVENAELRLAEITEELGCSIRLFILAVMTSAKVSSPDRPFYANMLFGPSAISRFEAYREQCRVRFGQFDFKTIELTNPSAIQKRFLTSEVLFGAFIIDAIIYLEGDVPFINFYSMRELALDHFWLAIEDTYLEEVLRPHVEGTLEKTMETSKHRSTVAQARRVLLKSKARAATVFKLRESVCKEAIDQVLRRYRLYGNDLLYHPNFDDMLELWQQIGLAVRRVVLLRILGDIA
jgi:hypothetical protein